MGELLSKIYGGPGLNRAEEQESSTEVGIVLTPNSRITIKKGAS